MFQKKYLFRKVPISQFFNNKKNPLAGEGFLSISITPFNRCFLFIIVLPPFYRR